MLSVLLSANTVILASMLGLKTDLSAETQADNTQAIQDVLDNLNKLGGGTLFFDQPGTYTVGPERCNTPGTPNYRVNSSLVVYSNTTIEGVNGVTLRRANNSNCYFLRNNLAGDSTLRDENIEIRNINFDFNHKDGTGGNSNAQGPTPRGAGFWWEDGIWFDRVDGLTITDGTYVRAAKYLIWITNCTDGYYARLRMKNTNSDGLHFGAGCWRHRTDNIYANVNDNALPIIVNEGAYRSTVSDQYCQSPTGSSGDFVFTNTVLDNCFEAFRFAGSTGNTISNVLVDGVTGTSSTATWWSVSDDNADIGNGTLAGIIGGTHTGIVIRNARVVCPAGNFTGGISATNCKDITLENIHTAPDNDLLVVFPAVAGMDFIKIVNCSAARAWRGWVTLNGTIDQVSETGSNVRLGPDGRLVHCAAYPVNGVPVPCAIGGISVSGGAVTLAPGSAHSSDFIFRTDPGVVVSRGVSCTKDVSGVSGIIDVQHTSEIAFRLAFLWAGDSGATSHVIYQRNPNSKSYIDATGLVYKDWSKFNDRGLVGDVTGTGYVRVNGNIRIRGRHVIAGQPLPASVIDGDSFYNTDTSGPAPFTVAGRFVHKGGAWVAA
jgi:hypothetical protein